MNMPEYTSISTKATKEINFHLKCLLYKKALLHLFGYRIVI